MNLPQFLKQIDAGVAEMPREMLEAFIHELARTLPEDRRSQFLNIMQTVKSADHLRALPADSYSDALASEIKEITAILKSIKIGLDALKGGFSL